LRRWRKKKKGRQGSQGGNLLQDIKLISRMSMMLKRKGMARKKRI